MKKLMRFVSWSLLVFLMCDFCIRRYDVGAMLSAVQEACAYKAPPSGIPERLGMQKMTISAPAVMLDRPVQEDKEDLST